MGFSVHGVGWMIYGQRDYWPDGSFITTEWFVFAWVPIVPICSKRISYTKSSKFAAYDAAGGYYVYETKGVDRKQALCVYLWFASLFAPFILREYRPNELLKLFGDEDRSAGLCLGLTAITLVFPYFLRRRAKFRKSEEWKRQRLGLPPVEM